MRRKGWKYKDDRDNAGAIAVGRRVPSNVRVTQGGRRGVRDRCDAERTHQQLGRLVAGLGIRQDLDRARACVLHRRCGKYDLCVRLDVFGPSRPRSAIPMPLVI